MDGALRPAKFTLEADASTAGLRELFEKIRAYRLQTGARNAIVHLSGRPALSREQLLAAVALLAEGCREGFKLAWVTTYRVLFEELVHTEYPSTRTSVSARAFFDEQNAYTWLAR